MKNNSISSPRVSASAAAQSHSRVSASAAAQHPSAPSGAASRVSVSAAAPSSPRAPSGAASPGAKAPLSGPGRAQSPMPPSGSTAALGGSPLSRRTATTLASRSSGDTLNFRARNACDTLCSPPSPWKLLADRCGLSEVTLRNAFARKPITWQTACRIAKNLEIQAASFRIKPDRRGRKK